MRNRSLYRIAAACSIFACASCGDSGGLVPVYGKVTYKGEPAEGAVVTFHRDGAGDAIPSGVADAAGEFSLESTPLGHGALPGHYSVLIKWPDGSNAGEAPARPEAAVKGKAARAVDLARTERRKYGYIQSDRLKGRYSQPGKPLLKAEVKPQTNRLPPFELTD